MRILGIDLGSKSIKAVEVDSAFGRYEIHEYHEQPLDAGVDPAQALTRLMHDLHKQPDRVVVTLKSSMVTLRNLTLPTKDKKAISSSIGFELEDELPFQIENAAYDYSILTQGKAGSQVHVGITLKQHVQSALGVWQASQVDPDVITPESWAYRCLLNRVLAPAGATAGATQSKPTLLVHLGHERTVLYLHLTGSPVFSREIAWGGKDLTLAICQKYHIPLDQAESAKLDHGFVIAEAQKGDVTNEQLEFSETLMQPIRELLREIRQTKLVCKNLTQLPLEAIFTAGGTALLPGLNRVIEEELKTPVKPLQSMSAIATSGVTYSEQTDAAFVLAAAAAMSLVGPDRAMQVNFRKGEFGKQGRGHDLNLSALKRPAQAVGAVALCLTLSLCVQSRVYESQLKDLDTQLERSMKGFFSGVSPSGIRTYLASPATLRTSVNKELTKQRDLNKLVSPNPHSPLDFLKELSSAIPRDVVVDLTQYQVGAAPTEGFSPTSDVNASLTLLTSNPQSTERLSGLLGGKLKAINRGKSDEVNAPDGSGKRWKTTFTGKPQEESYGK
jgi:type IV pilus assembly protein PilM